MEEVQLGVLKPEYLVKAKSLADEYTFHRHQGLEAHQRAQDTPARRKEFIDSATTHLTKAVSIGSRQNSYPLKPSDGGRMKIKKRNTNPGQS